MNLEKHDKEIFDYIEELKQQVADFEKKLKSDKTGSPSGELHTLSRRIIEKSAAIHHLMAQRSEILTFIDNRKN